LSYALFDIRACTACGAECRGALAGRVGGGGLLVAAAHRRDEAADADGLDRDDAVAQGFPGMPGGAIALFDIANIEMRH